MKRKNKKMLFGQQKNRFYCETKRKNNDNNDDDYQKEMQLNAGDNDFVYLRKCGFLKREISFFVEKTKQKKRRNVYFPQLLSIILLIFFIKIEIFVFASELTTSRIESIFHNNTNIDESRIFGHFQGRLSKTQTIL